MNCIKQRMLYACAQTYDPDEEDPERLVGWLAPPIHVNPIGQEPGPIIDFALVGRIPEGILVAIRGTLAPVGSGHSFDEVLRDWMNNADALATTDEDYPGPVHDGFAESTDRLWPGISAAVRNLIGPGNSQLFVTGHSKGGAVANLVAWRALGLAGLAEPIRVYTVAAARAGNEAFRDAYQQQPRIRCVRYESPLDIVPYLPPGRDTPRWAHELATQLWPGLLANNYASVGTRLPPGISWADRAKALARALRFLTGRPKAGDYLSALASAHDIRAGSGYDIIACPGEQGCAH